MTQFRSKADSCSEIASEITEIEILRTQDWDGKPFVFEKIDFANVKSIHVTNEIRVVFNACTNIPLVITGRAKKLYFENCIDLEENSADWVSREVKIEACHNFRRFIATTKVIYHGIEVFNCDSLQEISSNARFVTVGNCSSSFSITNSEIRKIVVAHCKNVVDINAKMCDRITIENSIINGQIDLARYMTVFIVEGSTIHNTPDVFASYRFRISDSKLKKNALWQVRAGENVRVDIVQSTLPENVLLTLSPGIRVEFERVNGGEISFRGRGTFCVDRSCFENIIAEGFENTSISNCRTLKKLHVVDGGEIYLRNLPSLQNITGDLKNTNIFFHEMQHMMRPFGKDNFVVLCGKLYHCGERSTRLLDISRNRDLRFFYHGRLRRKYSLLAERIEAQYNANV